MNHKPTNPPLWWTICDRVGVRGNWKPHWSTPAWWSVTGCHHQWSGR